MYFVLSKLVWAVLAPTNLLIILCLVGASLCFTRFLRWGRRLVLMGGVGLAVIGIVPIGDTMLAVLEARFPQFVDDGRPVDGVIVLGGAEEPRIAAVHHALALNDAAERMIAMADLARRYPDAKIVFSGGSGDLFGDDAESDMITRYQSELGLPANRIKFENKSRNTVENARFTKAMVSPAKGERWLLVTSAFHMPRAMGLFRHAGFDVIAYPVDYRSPGFWRFRSDASNTIEGHRRFDRALREYAGLAAARALGYSATLFPAP